MRRARDEEAGEVPVVFVTRRPGAEVYESSIIDFVGKQVRSDIRERDTKVCGRKDSEEGIEGKVIFKTHIQFYRMPSFHYLGEFTIFFVLPVIAGRATSISKKQDCTAMSSAEAEYVALFASCAQAMWMRTQIKDYGFNYNKIPLYCDSQSAIAISCNPVQHSHTKHIYTRYHFIKEHVENDIIELYFVRTEYQLDDMFTKALPEYRFQYLVIRIGMRCLTPAELEVLANESA
ncbi:hypothetical protein Tco_0196374 [Tanacetum coccineum]